MAGCGGIPELAGVIKAAMRKHPGATIGGICINHVAAMADRQARALNDYQSLRHLLRDSVLQASDLLARPYRAPALLLHELSPWANKKPPGTDFHHSDAAECRSFAQRAAHAIVCGPLSDQNIGKFVCTKYHTTPPMTYRLAKMVAEFNDVVDVSDEWVTCEDRTIVRRSEIEAFMRNSSLKTFTNTGLGSGFSFG
jgi:hypothetical protein